VTRPMSNGWRISEEYPIQKQGEFMRQMVEETLAEGPRPIPLVPKEFNGKPIAELSGEEREAFLLSMQPKSTQDALAKQKDRPAEEDLEFVLRPISEDYLAVKDAQSLDELVPARPISPQEFTSFMSMRASRGNRKGESKASSVSPEKRERAIEAFMYSPPAKPTLGDMKRLKSLTEMDAVAVTEISKEKSLSEYSWWERLKYRMFSYKGESMESYLGRK
jgi:hypothetical protein